MFSMLSSPHVVVKPKVVEIVGINYRDFVLDLERVYGTSVMAKYMFRRVNSYKFACEKFFLVELNFLLDKVLQLKNIASKRRDLSIILTKLKTETWIKDTIDLDVGPRLDPKVITSTFKLAPFESQWNFLKTYFITKNCYHLKGLLLHGVAGSGKTLNSIMLSRAIGKGKTIIFAPLKIIYSVWQDTLTNEKYWKGKPPKVWVVRDGKPLDTSADYFIYNYEKLSDLDNVMKEITLIQKANKNDDFKLLVDEIHNFNELPSKRTQALIKIADTFNFTDTIPMSGTPFKAQGRESYTTMALIDKHFIGKAREQFLNAYSRSRDKLNELLAHRIGLAKFTINSLNSLPLKDPIINVKVVVPNPELYTLKNIRFKMLEYIKERIKFYETNLEEFTKLFNDVIARYREYIEGEKSLIKELEEYITIVNDFRKRGYNGFEDGERAKYCKMVEEKIETFLPPTERKHFRNAKSVVKYVGLKIRGEALGNVLGKARILAVKALVAHSELPRYIDDAVKKTLIFTDYVDVLMETNDYLIKQGYKPCLVYGAGENTDLVVKEFKEKEEVNPLITTFKSLKEGYPLTMANQIIMMNAPWRSYIVEQTLARVHREGQDAKTIFYLMEMDTGTEENITSRSVDILEWSKQQVDELMGTFSSETMVGVAGLEDYITLMEDGEGELPPDVNLYELF